MMNCGMARAACAARTKGLYCVIGMGNPILTDDTVGIFAAQRAGELCRERGLPVTTIELHGWGLELLHELEGFDRALMIDSIMTGKRAPGECVRLGETELAAFAGGFINSHGFSLSCLLQTGRQAGCALPEELVLLAVEVKNVSDFSEQPTPEVSSCIERIAASAADIVAGWDESDKQHGSRDVRKRMIRTGDSSVSLARRK